MRWPSAMPAGRASSAAGCWRRGARSKRSPRRRSRATPTWRRSPGARRRSRTSSTGMLGEVRQDAGAPFAVLGTGGEEADIGQGLEAGRLRIEARVDLRLAHEVRAKAQVQLAVDDAGILPEGLERPL